MRQGPPNNGRRPRGRHHGGHGGGSNHSSGSNHSGGSNNGNSTNNQNSVNRPRSAAALRHQTFDSNCIDVRVRGNAWQVFEKYQALARDATSSGDRVAAENYLQHAEHYYRIIEAINEATAAEQQQQQRVAPAFGQQPEVPANYYGATQTPPGAPQSAPVKEGQNPATSAQAEVEIKTPPSPFFSAEEAEEQESSEPPLVAQR